LIHIVAPLIPLIFSNFPKEISTDPVPVDKKKRKPNIETIQYLKENI